jgi:DNA-binding GntR family transcriptional regulator
MTARFGGRAVQGSNRPSSSYSPNRSFDKATLADRVYQNLRADILSNRLPPDSPLQESAIASALEVSRGPVREALRRLEAEGLVSLIPRRGAVVSSLSRQEFLDGYRVREALETLALRLAIPRLGKDDLAELERLHELMIQHAAGEDRDAFFAANTAFHALIVARSGNRQLQQFYQSLVNQMRRYQLRSALLRGGLSRSCEEHLQILQAIKAGDADRAAALLSEHIRVPQRILESDSNVELVPRAKPSDDDREGPPGEGAARA